MNRARVSNGNDLLIFGAISNGLLGSFCAKGRSLSTPAYISADAVAKADTEAP